MFEISRRVWVLVYWPLFFSAVAGMLLTSSWAVYWTLMGAAVLFIIFTSPRPKKTVSATLADARHDVGDTCGSKTCSICHTSA